MIYMIFMTLIDLSTHSGLKNGTTNGLNIKKRIFHHGRLV